MFVMLTSNEALCPSDLIRPLDLTALEYFASGTIPLANSYETVLRGKFIRIGEVIIIGSTIKYGRPDMAGRSEFLKHWELLEHLQDYEEELYAKAQGPPVGDQLEGGELSDAGFTLIAVTNSIVPIQLNIDGESRDYGRADAAGRQRTIEIAQGLVGNTVTVVGI